MPDLPIIHADVDYGQSLVRAGELDKLAGNLASFIDRLASGASSRIALRT